MCLGCRGNCQGNVKHQEPVATENKKNAPMRMAVTDASGLDIGEWRPTQYFPVDLTDHVLIMFIVSHKNMPREGIVSREDPELYWEFGSLKNEDSLNALSALYKCCILGISNRSEYRWSFAGDTIMWQSRVIEGVHFWAKVPQYPPIDYKSFNSIYSNK